jgi:hypothetical protein
MVRFLDLEAVVAAPDMASPVRRDAPVVKGWLLWSGPALSEVRGPAFA